MGLLEKPGLEFLIIYSDEHLIEVRVTASNGRFRGETDVYGSLEMPAELAATLSGFPSTIDDVRMLELGKAGEASLGSATIRLFCRDLAGHVTIDIRLRSESDYWDRVNTVALHVDLEAAAIDELVAQLRKMGSTVGSFARITAGS